MTAIWLNTQNIIIFILAFVLSIMIAENRIESNKKNVSETIFGACVGILIVLLVYGITMIR